MKTLVVLRHAKASPESESGNDFDRPLNARGRRSAKAVGRELKPRMLAFDAVLASPALRVRETLNLLGEAYGGLPQPRFDRELYSATSATLRGSLQLLDDGFASVLLAGHNPGLHHLLLELATAKDPLRPQIVDNLPTGAAAILELDIGCWRELAEGSADVCDLVFPRNLLA